MAQSISESGDNGVFVSVNFGDSHVIDRISQCADDRASQSGDGQFSQTWDAMTSGGKTSQSETNPS